jgi:hypothetical protein
MDQAANDYVLAVRVLHTGSIIMTHAVGHARAVAASYPALRSSCMSSPLSPSSVPPPGQIRGEGVCRVTLQTVKPGRPGCPGGRVLRVLRSDHFPIILILSTTPSTQQNRKRKSKGSKTPKAFPRPVSICSTYNTRSTILLRLTAPQSRTGLRRGLGSQRYYATIVWGAAQGALGESGRGLVWPLSKTYLKSHS